MVPRMKLTRADQVGFEVDQVEISHRFAQKILIPLAGVFKLTPAVLNVFWDHDGPLIAFNRGGALFCNARYFRAWREFRYIPTVTDKSDNADVVAGQRGEAFISWYFTLAHGEFFEVTQRTKADIPELAHNLGECFTTGPGLYFEKWSASANEPLDLSPTPSPRHLPSATSPHSRAFLADKFQNLHTMPLTRSTSRPFRKSIWSLSQSCCQQTQVFSLRRSRRSAHTPVICLASSRAHLD